MNLQPLDPALLWWIGLPATAQWVALVVLGLAIGSLANHAITTWCWCSRPVSPWSNPAAWPLTAEQSSIWESLPPRGWRDRVPIFGWLRQRREHELLGEGFWIRPLLIELSLAIAVPWMHHAWLSGQLLPDGIDAAALAMSQAWMTRLFFFHVVLVGIMVAATFIDFDERTIPDSLTLPGTLFALMMMTISPLFALPAADINGLVSPVTLNHPAGLRASWMATRGLVMGLGIWTLFCFGLADRRVILRRGWKKAVEFFCAGLVRHGSWKFLLALWLVGLVAVFSVHRVGGLHWIGLITSLVGLAIGGGVVWAIRLVGRWALRKEAMGFGDVTLMAMIGAFVGWQASLIAFFVSPIAAILIVLVRFVVTRDAATPFGPYLCMGTVLTLLFWTELYDVPLQQVLGETDDLLIWFSLAMLGVLGVLLQVIRVIKQLFA